MKHIQKYDTYLENIFAKAKAKEKALKIYCDMDGVLTDFDEAFNIGALDEWNKEHNTHIKDGWEFEDEYGADEFWLLIDSIGPEFWTEMPWMKDGKELWNYIKDLNTEILSKPSKDKSSREGKRVWCKRELGNVKVNLSRNKKTYAKPNHILIDDLEENINPWTKSGGIGILHKNTKDTIEQLKKYL